MDASKKNIEKYLTSPPISIALTKETHALIIIVLSQLALVRTATGSLEPGRIQLIGPPLVPPYPHIRARIETSLETLSLSIAEAFTEILIAHEIIARASP
ncbi:MAG: hypothetical protein JSR76_04670 [Verrucomicrobia bacterium]|nr:hypothetical protein [Verrucomicrobiota bacterium]